MSENAPSKHLKQEMRVPGNVSAASGKTRKSTGKVNIRAPKADRKMSTANSDWMKMEVDDDEIIARGSKDHTGAAQRLRNDSLPNPTLPVTSSQRKMSPKGKRPLGATKTTPPPSQSSTKKPRLNSKHIGKTASQDICLSQQWSAPPNAFSGYALPTRDPQSLAPETHQSQEVNHQIQLHSQETPEQKLDHNPSPHTQAVSNPFQPDFPPAELGNRWVWNVTKATELIRQPDEYLGITYPDDLFESVLAGERDAALNVFQTALDRKGGERAWHGYPIYIIKLEKNTDSPFREIRETTFDLNKANTYALLYFRRWVAKRFPALAAKPHDQEHLAGKPEVDRQHWCRHAWVRHEWSIRDKGRLGWFLNQDGGVVLSAHLPGTDFQFTVRVEAHRILQ
ncbi:hypothetical protein JX265_012344 [Neoarthrinium moseri]|uniref:Uncharacterized protein n=1 Tax=Neoarthrinium moseri TaxID=1658444 RepID=A0A9Q0AJS8_9PEZI|nr:uncharacterized protein JN550_011208 [Neoarthrinium moseri]KAI1851574.1 hypothetical protein JX266_003036 [Neoarthrinium moseri]KAI1854989.1 hypothetical protein JX265_012344 [Neoarthrinium moseri]KAI1860893.1 hypothetical protein JN550_011208 [Neoarthrinium moseri]